MMWIIDWYAFFNFKYTLLCNEIMYLKQAVYNSEINFIWHGSAHTIDCLMNKQTSFFCFKINIKKKYWENLQYFCWRNV